MYLSFDLNRRFAENIWLGVGIFCAGFVFFELSDSAALYKLARMLLPLRLANWTGTVFTLGGLALSAAGIYAMYQWLRGYIGKQKADRREAMRQAAAAFKYEFHGDRVPDDFAPFVQIFGRMRERALPQNARLTGSFVSNVITHTTGGDRLAVFDYQADVEYSKANDGHFTLFETIFLVASPALDLPYFQTQPNSTTGDVIDLLFKSETGEPALTFPDSPAFSARQRLVADDPARAARLFDPTVRRFYEQAAPYRTMGESQTLCLVAARNAEIDQAEIAAQLNLLYGLFRILKSAPADPRSA